MQDLNIALLQASLYWESPAENRQHLQALMEQQSRDNDLIVLPETFSTGFPVDPHRFAEVIEGPGMAWMHNMAVTHQAVVCGSLLLNRNNSFSNTFVWMRPDGTYETYDKAHVFRMGGEHEHIRAGNQLITLELKGWKIRPMVCYDLRFPVWSRNRFENGVYAYDLLLYVANWPEQRAWPWSQLLIARAIENMACVVGLNRVGTDGVGNRYSGDSVVLNAKGQQVAAAPAHRETVLETTLVAADMLIFRDKFQVALDWDWFNILHLPPDS